MLYGFCSNMSMLILYFTVITFKTNISIGIFSTIATVISMLILAIYNVKKQWFNNYVSAVLSSVLIALSISCIIFSLNRITLIVFYLCWNVSIVIPEIITSARRLNIVKQNHLTKYNIENILLFV